MKNNPVIWVLADDKAGNVNQCLGVVEALGCDYIRKNIVYNKTARLPNIIRGNSLLGVNTLKSDPLTGPYPDMVIAAGRETSPIANYIKMQKPDCIAVQLMWPGYPLGKLDLIAIPDHDKRKGNRRVLVTMGTPHRVTQAKLDEAEMHWQPAFDNLPKPFISLIIGGNTKYGRFTAAYAKTAGEEASKLAASLGGSLLITTSRRTDPEAVNALRSAISVPHYFYNFETGGENPYFGLLALGDVLIVTGDSMSMCSEACATGKKVMIYAPPEINCKKHLDMHQKLFDLGYAAPFPGNIPLESKRLPNCAVEIAAEIKKRFYKQ